MREGLYAALMHDDVHRNLERRLLQVSNATKKYKRQRLEMRWSSEEPIDKIFAISTARSLARGFFPKESGLATLNFFRC